MLQDIRPFRPAFELGNNLGQNGAVTGSAQTFTLPVPGVRLGTLSIRFVNSGTDIVWIRFDGTAGAPSTNSLALLPNTVEVFDLNSGVLTVSYIGQAGTGSTLSYAIGESA